MAHIPVNPLLGPPPGVASASAPGLAVAAPVTPSAAGSSARDILKDLPQPGTYDNLHSEVKYMLAQNYHVDGAKVAVTKPISSNFQVSHTIDMGFKPSYHFGATYVGEPKFGGPEFASPLLMGEIDTGGNLVARIMHWVNPRLMTRVLYQTQDDRNLTELGAEYKGDDFTASLRVQQPDIVNEGGTWVASYLQSVTKSVAIGGELIYEYHGAMEAAQMNIGARYKSDAAICTSTLSQGGELAVTYGHKVNEKIMLGTDLLCNLLTREALCSVAYQFDMRQNAVRGQVNSKGVITGVLENKLAPGLSFSLTGMMNHFTGQSAFGMSFTLGQ